MRVHAVPLQRRVSPGQSARRALPPLAATSPLQRIAIHSIVHRPPRLQPKLTVGPADDAFEREADRVAEQVVRMPEPEVRVQPALQQANAPRVEVSGASGGTDAAVVRRRGESGGGATPVCDIPTECPASFCAPLRSRLVARAMRATLEPVLLTGIAAKVSPRVVGLWRQYLFGGSPPQDLSSSFGSDFTSSATTARTTDFLVGALEADLERNPPAFSGGATSVTVDLAPRIPDAIAEIGDPTKANVMDFSVIGEIPGNIAGGVGKTQTTCPVGAQPSPFDDERTAGGRAEVTRNPDGTLTVVPRIEYTVKDTIDLCPGNCGARLEQVATVPMSQFEATGISGDVPFVVNFPAPPRTVTARPPSPPPPPPSPTAPTP